MYSYVTNYQRLYEFHLNPMIFIHFPLKLIILVSVSSERPLHVTSCHLLEVVRQGVVRPSNTEIASAYVKIALENHHFNGDF